MLTPFQRKGGTRDLYESSPALYFSLQIIMWIYLLGSIAYLVLIMNTTIRHTYLSPPSMPGTLISDRFHTFTWIFLMLSVLSNLCIAFLVPMLILWRKDACCSIFWMIFLVLFTIASVFTVAVLGALWGSCNGQNQNGNLCNSREWCCAVEIYSNPANLCFNTGPCPLPEQPSSISELKSNIDFRWIFAVAIVFMVFNLIFVTILTCLWFGASQEINWDAIEKEGMEKELEEQQEKSVDDIEQVVVSIPGLRSRKQKEKNMPQEQQQTKTSGGIEHTAKAMDKAKAMDRAKPRTTTKQQQQPSVVVNFAANKKAK